VKDKVLFKSKEYGHNGHNYCELRILEDGDVRLWVHDGGTNSLICMDRDELIELAKQLTKHGPTAPEEHKSVDIFRRNKKEVTQKRKRKTRSDKGKPKAKKAQAISTLDMDQLKADNVTRVMEE
jgi:hypothetical protein